MMENKLLFVVDDDPLISKVVTRKLAEEGYQVESFERGEDCIAALGNKPTLVILDYIFTNDTAYSTGMEIFNKIKEIDSTIPIIMLSSQEDGEVVLELARKGMDDYVLKDSNIIKNLLQSIEDVLSR